jgi:hypothetical protein
MSNYIFHMRLSTRQRVQLQVLAELNRSTPSAFVRELLEQSISAAPTDKLLSQLKDIAMILGIDRNSPPDTILRRLQDIVNELGSDAGSNADPTQGAPDASLSASDRTIAATMAPEQREKFLTRRKVHNTARAKRPRSPRIAGGK